MVDDDVVLVLLVKNEFSVRATSTVDELVYEHVAHLVLDVCVDNVVTDNVTMVKIIIPVHKTVQIMLSTEYVDKMVDVMFDCLQETMD